MMYVKMNNGETNSVDSRQRFINWITTKLFQLSGDSNNLNVTITERKENCYTTFKIVLFNEVKVVLDVGPSSNYLRNNFPYNLHFFSSMKSTRALWSDKFVNVNRTRILTYILFESLKTYINSRNNQLFGVGAFIDPGWSIRFFRSETDLSISGGIYIVEQYKSGYKSAKVLLWNDPRLKMKLGNRIDKFCDKIIIDKLVDEL